MNDSELLERYSEGGCEAAFTEVVQRHVDLVFSAALRQVGGDRHLAEDVTQSVFTDLARKARDLARRELLSGWLYTSTRFAAAKRVRAEQRRFAREQEAYNMQPTSAGPEETPDWLQLETVLDEAMHELKERDRDAVLLRYFEGRPFAEVGQKLGLSEDGARMRVDRALEKLRALLGERGIASTCAALGAALAQQAVTAAPAGVAMNIAGTAMAGALAAGALTATATGGATAATAAGGETTLTILKIMGMTKLKAAGIAVVMAGVAVPLVIQHQSNEALRGRNDSLARQNEQFAQQLTPLAAENTRLSNLLARTAPPVHRESSNELFQLRAEVTRLRQEAREAGRAVGSVGRGDDPINATLQTLGARVASLRERLEQMPETKIPELQYLSEKDWLDAVAGLQKMETDDEYREALNMLRAQAKGEVGGKLQAAIQKYADANGGMLPTDLAQVQSYLEKPLDQAILDRYQMVGTGKLNDLRKDQSVFEEVAAPVDEEFDTYFRFHRNGRSSTSFSQIGFAIEAAAEAYANANGGKLPRDATQLSPYLTQPIEPARVQKFLTKIPPNITTLAEMKARQN